MDYSDIKQEADFVFSKEYLEGCNAYPNTRISDNPYSKGSVQYMEWFEGWHNAEAYAGYLGTEVR